MARKISELMIKALLNNSFHDGIMSTRLKRTLYDSYSYLYNLQLSQIGYDELCYFSGDPLVYNTEKYIGKLRLDNLNRPFFDIKHDIFRLLENEKYRKSNYYLQEFTIQDMVYHPEIFFKMPVVIIDDKVLWDFKLKITKDHTIFILPFQKNFVMHDDYNDGLNRREYQKHKIQILSIKNDFYDRYTYNKNTIKLDSSKKIYINRSEIIEKTNKHIEDDTNREVLKEFHKDNLVKLTSAEHKVRHRKINYRQKMLTPLTDSNGIMMCSLHFPNSKRRGYELGTILIPLTYDSKSDNYTATLTDDIYKTISNYTQEFYVSLIYFRGLHHHKFYNGNYYTKASSNGADLFVLEEEKNTPYKSPIPEDNFMVFKKKKDCDGFILERNDKMIELHYPNIYRIKDEKMQENEVYDIYYFYYDSQELKYTVMFDYYFQFLYNKFNGKENSLEKVINDIYYKKAEFNDYTKEEINNFYEVFKKISDYEAFHYKYGESDFLYRYSKIEGNEENTPFDYKVNTYRSWIKQEPWILRDYVREQKNVGESYHLFTNTIDLSKRLRYDTSQEFDKNPVAKFDEPMYVFTFSNKRQDPTLLDLKIFVDGLHICETYLHHDRKLFMDYFYIPTRFVTNDSYIEIEVFPEYSFTKELNFKSLNDEIDISLLNHDKDIFPTYADLFFNTKNDNNELSIIDPGYFDIVKKTKDLNVNVKDLGNIDEPVKFTNLETFSIKANDEKILNKPITLKIRKFGHPVAFTVKENCSYLCLRFAGNFLNRTFALDYIRIYHENGRFIPKSICEIMPCKNGPYLFIFKEFKKGETITIDFTPFRYKEIYYQKELDKDNPLINLNGFLTKPFDVRYYDIYLNGRKLSINNVFALSPDTITLVNIKSTHNLYIYERERDWEYFGYKGDKREIDWEYYGLDYQFKDNKVYYFSFEDFMKSGAMSSDDKNKLIRSLIDKQKDEHLNIVPNTDEEEAEFSNVEDAFNFDTYIYYFNRLIPKGFYNPDIKQESLYLMENIYPVLYHTYVKKPKNATFNDYDRKRKANFPRAIELDPDIIVEGSNKKKMLVYPIGHLRDVDETIFKETDNSKLMKLITQGPNVFDKANTLVYRSTIQTISGNKTIVNSLNINDIASISTGTDDDGYKFVIFDFFDKKGEDSNG